MSNLLGSKVVRRIIWVLGGLLALFLAFGAGISVGYHRAGFAAGFDQNYYRNFYGQLPPPGPMGVMGMMMPGVGGMPGHGIIGTVIDVGTSTISVTDSEHNEQSIAVSSGTIIREGGQDVAIGAVAAGDHVAVIGEPNASGQVDARFVRVFPASSTPPLP